MKKYLAIMVSLILTLTTVGCSKTVEQQVAEQLELGQKYLSELNYEEAIVAFQKVIELDPKVWDAYTGIAKVYFDQEKYAEAAGILEDGLLQIPMSDTTMILEVYKKWSEEAKIQGDNKLLLELYEKTLELKPNDKDISDALDDIKKQIDEENSILQYEQSLKEMALKIIEEENYDFSDALILSEDFQSMVKELSNPVIFPADGDRSIGVYPGGYIYFGQMHDDKREGEGRWFYGTIKQITIVSANWSNDKPNGPASIYIKRNPELIEREEGYTYALETITTCELIDGVYDGSAEIIWNMDSEEVHDWNVMYSDGYLQDQTGDGNAAFCNNCGANLLVSDKYNKIEGID